MESRSLWRFAAFLAIMALWVGVYDAGALAAPNARTSLTAVMTVSDSGRTPEQCDQICGPEVECDEPCLYIPEPPFEAFESTCGEYEGGGSQGYCLGECGDGYCNGYAGEEYGECEDDCGYCGDGICQRPTEAAGSGYCATDCGPNTPDENECNPTTDSGCSGGDSCNAQAACVPPEEPCSGGGSHGHCHNNSDCCEDSYCYILCNEYPWTCFYGEPGQEEFHPNGVCLPRNVTVSVSTEKL